MLTQIHRTLTAFLLIISLIWGLGCESNNSVKPDTEPPAIPRGVVSITGDEQVTVEWFPNGERDLAGYKIWRSPDDDEFNLLAELSNDSFQYVDNDVRNGATYFYAVSAYDVDGNESELSPERVPDTPRPSGNNVTLDDFTLSPDRSGFDFSQPEKGAIAWDSSTTDVYFGLDTVVNVTYLYSADHKQSEMPAMRAFFTFPPTRSTESHGRLTNTLEPPAISARSKNEFPPKQERRITAFNQLCHYHIAIGMPYS